MRRVVVAALIVLAVLGMLLESDGREATLTTFGSERAGFKALYDLFNELGISAPRSYTAPRNLPAGATVWWLHASQPSFDVNSGPCATSEGKEPAEAWQGKEWLDAGGTAVVFPAPAVRSGTCDTVAGFPLPPRLQIDEEGRALGKQDRTELKRRRLRDPYRFAITDERQRIVRSYSLHAFEGRADWTEIARIGERPFVLERNVGAGRLVVVADGTPLQNAWLAAADAAPFALDLVRRYGVPSFDENAHGFRPSQDTLTYLVESPALWVWIGLTLLGGLVVWRGALVPGRSFETGQPPGPALDSYVDSLAGWYARTTDYGAVAERYRQYALARVRRQLHLPAETPLRIVAERLQSQAAAGGSMPSTILQPAVAASRDELFAAAAALDAVIRTAPGPRGSSA
jgi:hypothetical protein